MSSETRKTKKNRNQDVFEIFANISPSHWLPTNLFSILPENPPHFKLPDIPSRHDQSMSLISHRSVTVWFTEPKMSHTTWGLKCQPTFLIQPCEKGINPVVTTALMGSKGLCKASWLHLLFLLALPIALNTCHYS